MIWSVLLQPTSGAGRRVASMRARRSPAHPTLLFEDWRCVSLSPTRAPPSLAPPRSTLLRSALKLAPAMAEAGRAHRRRRSLASEPLTTHRVNHHLRLFLLYDWRTSAETETTGAARSSEPLPSPPLAAVAALPQATTGRAEAMHRCARAHVCCTATPRRRLAAGRPSSPSSPAPCVLKKTKDVALK